MNTATKGCFCYHTVKTIDFAEDKSAPTRRRSGYQQERSRPGGAGSPGAIGQLHLGAERNGQIRFLILESSPSLLKRLSSILAPWPKLSLIGTALDAHHALRKVLELDPDLVVVGSQLEGMSGLDLVRQVRALGRGARIILVTESVSSSAASADACLPASLIQQLPAVVQRIFPKSITDAPTGRSYL